MAYVQTPTSNRRALTIGAVGMLHVALGYALVTGFTATVFEKIDDLVPTRQWPADPPPPEPSAAPSAVPEPSRATAPRSDIDLGPRTATAEPAETFPLAIPTGLASGGDPGPALPPEPTPSAAFTPRGASPLGNPGKWATPGDYPAAALREEREGVARFRVTVGADGRVNNCEIVASSGSADLDRATCANVAKRARFKPATDASGEAVAGSYTSAVKWEIPG